MGLSRLFLSHSSANNREAIALKQWLGKQNPRLANEIFLDLDPGTGIHIGQRWREALNRAATRCEGVVCLLSTQWESSEWCRWGENESPPTIVLPLDQAEELLSPDGAEPASRFLALMHELADPEEASRLEMFAVATIRSDRFGGLQSRPELARA